MHNEELHEYIRPKFDSILAEDYRLLLEKSCPQVPSHILDELAIEQAQMAWDWRQELREEEVLNKEWED